MNTEPQTPVNTSRTIASDTTVIVQNNGGPLEVLSLPAKSNADYEAEIKMWRDAAYSAKEQRNTIIDEGAEKQGRIDYLERELIKANIRISVLSREKTCTDCKNELLCADLGKCTERDDLHCKLSTANARIAELKQALTGRTVSCAACEEMAEENRRLKTALEKCLPLVTEKDIAPENVMPALLPTIRKYNEQVHAALTAIKEALTQPN